MYAMGITQHTSGHGNVMSCANLQMLLGNMGVPGGGVNPLRGQSNVQGACDMGGLPNYYSGYQNVALEASRTRSSRRPGARVPPEDKPGLTVVEMMNAAERRARSRRCTSSARIRCSPTPTCNHVRHCLESLDFLVVQDLFMTETAQLADVVLPGASFAEKDGTFTNSERRVQLVRRALNPLGESRTGLGDHRRSGPAAARSRRSGRSAGGASRRAARRVGLHEPGRDHGRDRRADARATAASATIGWRSWAACNGRAPTRSIPGTPILHVGKFTRGLGKLSPMDFLPPVELPDETYPLLLTTGRVLYHYHTGSLTRRSQGLAAIYPEGLDRDAPRGRGAVGRGERRDGAGRQPPRPGQRQADVTEKIQPGVVFMTFHFAESAANLLTNSGATIRWRRSRSSRRAR